MASKSKIPPGQKMPEPRMYGQPLLNIEKGERMYKWYIFRPFWGRDRSFEYRVMTKEKADGTLEMVAYNFKIVNGQPEKSNISHAPSVPKEAMEDIIQGVAKRTNTRPEELEIIDLSGFKTVDEQLAYLKEKDRVETHYVA